MSESLKKVCQFFLNKDWRSLTNYELLAQLKNCKKVDNSIRLTRAGKYLGKDEIIELLYHFYTRICKPLFRKLEKDGLRKQATKLHELAKIETALIDAQKLEKDRHRKQATKLHELANIETALIDTPKKPLAFTEVQVQGDGNCFFSCLRESLSRSGHDISIENLRTQIVTNLQSYNLQQYGISRQDINQLYTNGTWNNDAMDLVPEVAAELLDRPIIIYLENGYIEDLGPEEGEPIHLRLVGNHYSLLIPLNNSRPHALQQQPPHHQLKQPREQQQSQKLRQRQ